MGITSRRALETVSGNRYSDGVISGDCSEPRICIIGVGYVGESLLHRFSTKFQVVGYDVSPERVKALSQKYHGHSTIKVTTQTAWLKNGTHFLIAVPTPLRSDQSVDLGHIHAALDLIVSVAQRGSCIVIESSVPIGTTRQLLEPYGSLFHGGMSPERIDPGRLDPPAEDIPKIISGLTYPAIKQISAVYGAVYKTLVPVTRPEVAEMTKLHENCYRMVNIAYVNEISDACLAHGIDPREMIEAASTKPFGFQPFFPGLGVGGHCLPVNPWYLFHNNKKLKVLELATKLMAQRPHIQARRFHKKCVSIQNARDICLSGGPRILVVGLGFKGGQNNIAFSPAVSFAEELKAMGCTRLAYYDPSVEAHCVPWLERLTDESWITSYVDNKFDGVAWCNRFNAIDTNILDSLQRTLVKSFVW